MFDPAESIMFGQQILFVTGHRFERQPKRGDIKVTAGCGRLRYRPKAGDKKYIHSV